MTTFSLVTLGCKTNRFESAMMAEMLRRSGYQQVDFSAPATLTIINTCTVTAATDAQSRNLIRRAKRLNPEAQIIVTGCYAQIDPQSLSRLPGVRLVLGNEEKYSLLEHLQPDSGQDKIRVTDLRQVEVAGVQALSSFDQRSRAFVQVQNGCDAFCSYCIIPYARGPSRSVPGEKIVDQIEILGAAGYEEIVLTGIHIGRYGEDLQPRSDLLGLLRRIERSKFSGRLRLGSIEPTEWPEALVDYVTAADWICPHFHIPLQAGDDEILRGMNRHYATADYARLLARLRQRSPEAAIGLDLITGFPGETENQFISTCTFLEHLPLTHLHVFPYSRRPGTPAAAMQEQLPTRVIKERVRYLRELGQRKLTAYAAGFVGRQLEIIVEGGRKRGLRTGLSANYLPVRFAAEIDQGRRVAVNITSVAAGVLQGEVCG